MVRVFFLMLASAGLLARFSSSEVVVCNTGEEFSVDPGEQELRALLFGVLEPDAGKECGDDWIQIPGAFLSGYATEDPIGFSNLTSAQSFCLQLGEACQGVTLQPCLVLEGGFSQQQLYTPRQGQEPLDSPQGEVSWLKACSLAAETVATLGGDGEEEGEEALNRQLEPFNPTMDDCDKVSYYKLRIGVEEFYKNGVPNLNLLSSIGDIFWSAEKVGWEPLLAQCAPGALQGLLVLAEESLYIKPYRSAALVDEYLRLLHLIFLSGWNPAVHQPEAWASWPLLEGWSRTARLQREVREALQKSDGGNTVDFVLCFCGTVKAVGPGFPGVEDSLGWLVKVLIEEWHKRPATLKDLTRIFVIEKCASEADPGLEAAFQAAFAGLARTVQVIPVEDQIRADDATAYMAHLAGPHYEDPADFTFFLHADAPEHIHPVQFLNKVVSAALAGSLDGEAFPFLYLSFNYLDLAKSGHTWDNYASPALWRQLFGSSIAPDRSVVKGYCCVQFVVPKKRWLQRPRRWYQDALAFFGEARSYHSLFPVGKVAERRDIICRAPAQYWMPWWHVVFGENLTCPERHADPRLPLFIQAASVPTDRMSCC